MRRFLNGLIAGLVLGAAATWYFLQGRDRPLVRQAGERVEEAAERAVQATTQTAYRISEALKAKFEALDLTVDDVKEELARTGQVVRRKAREVGAQITDATADARIVATIKARLAADRDLSAWAISVSCSEGRVRLSGSVDAPELISKAVVLALETDGVRDVTADLQVKAKR